MKKDSNFKFNVVFFLNKFEFENYINIINHKQYIENGMIEQNTQKKVEIVIFVTFVILENNTTIN